MKKTALFILVFALIVAMFGTMAVSAGFGLGVESIAEETKIIKSGLFGRKITFSDADIKQGLCITDFESITVTKLPPSSDGTLMLAGRRVSEGATIKRKNIAALVFIPASREVTGTEFKITVDEAGDGCEISFILKYSDKINYEPKIEPEYKESLNLTTQREIGIHGKMIATDSEGDKLEYIVIAYPTEGTLTKVDKSTGEYVYTPRDLYVGEDSFVYVVRDEWGNFSETQKVSIKVSERLSEVIYRDMEGSAEYNAAVALTAMGIMCGKVIGDGVYFTPEASVTRAEFLAMALKAKGIKASEAGITYFDDNDEIPAPLLGYVVTAQKMGICDPVFKDGRLLFRPNEAITKYEAAVIMANILGESAEGDVTVFSDYTTVPVWARASVYTMYSLGIFDTEEDTIGGKDAITKAECAEYIYRMIT